MNDQRMSEEALLIDFHRGELSEPEAQQVRDRLEQDESFRDVHEDIARTLRAVALVPEVDPPEDLVGATMTRIRQVRRTEALLTREESRRMSRRPTFSWRELAGVAAAVLLMAAIFVPSIRQSRRMSLIGQCATNIGSIGRAMIAYANANNDMLPAVAAQSGRWLAQDSGNGEANSAALFKLVRSGYATPKAFVCPEGSGEPARLHAGMTDFPHAENIAYSYQHTLGNQIRRSDRALCGVAEELVILGDRTPLRPGMKFCPESAQELASPNHGGEGQNVLYLDQHVSWAKTPDVGVRGDNIYLADGIMEYQGDEKPAGATDTFLLPAFSGR